ncbi:MFS transporter [Tersicoccus phoenicis]|uniref:MFS transporter n=1 Tax=Tersicoccus phoenicis TaxID=554083 RepID=A0A1R1LGP4_9MICC|nr:MFS transporter [Tersicoccus phoenicis]OMH26672.1 MFS transporter [Tersicoccus phoenicis]
MLSVLRLSGYRRLFTAQVLALVGTGLLTVALGLLAYDIAGRDAGAVLGTALAIKMLAYVFVSPVMAALVHRWQPRTVMIGADIIRAAAALSLPWVSETWQIYVLVFVLQSASATFTPTFQSVIPSIVTAERDYTRALSLSRLAYDLESIVSPMLAAALLTVISYTSLFLGTAAGFVCSATLVTLTAIPKRVTTVSAPFLERLSGGVRVFFRNRSLRFVLFINGAVSAGTALVVVNSVVFARDQFGLGDTSLSFALAAYGAGSLLMAFLVPRVVDRYGPPPVMITGSAVATVGLLGALAMGLFTLGTSPGWVLLLVMWFVIGAGTSLMTTPSSQLLLRASSEQNRNQVYTAQFALSHACFLITYPLAGWLGAVDLNLATAVLTVVAVGSALGALGQRRASATRSTERSRTGAEPAR